MGALPLTISDAAAALRAGEITSVELTTRVLERMGDGGDPDVATAPVDDYVGALTGSLAGLRVGVPTPYFFDSPLLDPEVHVAVSTAIEELRGIDAEIVETAVPLADQAKNACMITMFGEAFAAPRNDLAARWSDYGRSTRAALGLGAMFTAGDYAQAQRLRRVFRRSLAEVFSDVDVLITPTTLGPAPRADEMDYEMLFTAPGFTPQWNFSGLPALAAPVGFSSGGLPLSTQIVARPFAEATALQVADAPQRVTDWHLRSPATVSA